MITIPIAVPTNLFKWQASLFQFAQEKVYGSLAYNNAKIVIARQNYHDHPLVNSVNWDLRIPFYMVDSIYQSNPHLSHVYNVAVNVLHGVKQILGEIKGNEVINIIDCDVIALKPYTGPLPQDDEIICCDIYNNWHMKLLPGQDNYSTIEPFLKHNTHEYMNGGFVPMMIRKNTFANIVDDAIEYSLEIVKNNEDNLKGWWSAMFGLNAALHNHKVKMVSQDNCYFPNINKFNPDNHYWAHYSCDRKFHKDYFPNLNFKEFPHNTFYNTIREWMYR
jgi:hypothetical protein